MRRYIAHEPHRDLSVGIEGETGQRTHHERQAPPFLFASTQPSSPTSLSKWSLVATGSIRVSSEGTGGILARRRGRCSSDQRSARQGRRLSMGTSTSVVVQDTKTCNISTEKKLKVTRGGWKHESTTGTMRMERDPLATGGARTHVRSGNISSRQRCKIGVRKLHPETQHLWRGEGRRHVQARAAAISARRSFPNGKSSRHEHRCPALSMTIAVVSSFSLPLLVRPIVSLRFK